MKRTLLAVAALILAGPVVGAQSLVELRGSTTRYRFVDFTHTFSNHATIDMLYLGAPGSDELYLGVGYQWKPAPGLVVTPLVYGVGASQNDERGIALGANIFLDRGGWRVLCFAGHFFRLSGAVDDYDFLDALDATRVVARHWELGASAGFLRTGGAWNGLLGPSLKLNDPKGTTALSLRWGYDTELRLVRIVTF